MTAETALDVAATAADAIATVAPESAAVKYIAMSFAIALGVLGPAIGLGLATKAVIESIARQPEVEGQVSKYFWAGAGLIEACAIYALLVVILIGFVV
jgi:F-type H+-transporting ATPase subunit c